MTGELTDRLNGITLFGIALFWQKAIEYFTKCVIHFVTDEVEAYFTRDFNVDFWVAGRCGTRLIGGR